MDSLGATRDEIETDLREEIEELRDELIAALEKAVALQKERDRYRVALKELRIGRGPFRRDPLEHADSVIDAMKTVAAGALEGTWECDSTEAELDEVIAREKVRKR